MTSKFGYALADLGDDVVRLGSISGLTTSAEKGTVATSSIEFDNPDGTLEIEPFRAFTMEEDACTAEMCFKGYISTRTYVRAASMVTGAANRITASLFDINAVLSMKLISHSTFHYDRPAETDVDRIHWLLVQVLDTIVVHDNGLIDETNPVQLTKTDYSGQFPLQVLSDCANRSGKNFFIYNDPATGEISLAYFKSADAMTFNPSPLTISNDLADVLADPTTCFRPSKEATLERDPDLVYDGVYMRYTGGVVYVRVPGRFLARDVVGPDANTSDRNRAIELAQRMLDNHDSEAERVTCTVTLPAASVNFLMAGMGINAKFTHLPGWETGRDTTILERTIKQDINTKALYKVEVVLGSAVLVNFLPGTSDPDNEHQPLPPFVPGAGEFAFVQAAATTNDTLAEAEATFGGAITEGNLLVAQLLVRQPGAGSPEPTDFTAHFPDGWQLAIGPVGTSLNGRLNAIWLAYKIAGPSEPTTVNVPITENSTGSPNDGFLVLGEYSAGGEVTLASIDNGTLSGASNTASIPTLTPPAGAPSLMILVSAHEPNYFSTYSAGWTNRAETEQGGPRQALALVDQIDNSASGSYTGTATVAGIGESMWYLPGAVFTATGAEPAIGQTVAPESAFGTGTRTVFQTNYPYVPGSLVVKVNGNVVAVTETDPSTGLFTLPTAPAYGALITWTYNVDSQAPTGANNPPPPIIPPGTPGDPGDMPGGDGISRPPIQPYTPAEDPDGTRTVFTIVPYVAGQATQLIIGSRNQRKGIDWWELDPAAGTVELDEAPLGPDVGSTDFELITVWAMPLVAPPPTSTPSVAGLYGTGLNIDSKSNIKMGPQGIVALLFTAGVSDDLDSILIQARGGAAYSGGTGGAYDVDLYLADAAGRPTGSILAHTTYTPGNPGGEWTSYDTITWGTPETTTAGLRYCVVFENTNGSPLVNYISINCMFVFGGSLIPRQPLFADLAFGVLVDSGSGFVFHRQGGDFTPNMDLAYAGGHHDGQGYIQNMETTTYSGGTHVPGLASGANDLVRERCVLSGGARKFLDIHVRARLNSGSAPLICKLKQGATVLGQTSIPASAFSPATAPYNDNGGSKWGAANWPAVISVANAATIDVEFSTAAGTTYSFAPIRKGTDEGFDPSLVFMDGVAEFSTDAGANWDPLYPFDTDPPDLQFYMRVTP